MANPFIADPAEATRSTYASPEPPELGYKFFSPEFLDELEEHYAALAVGGAPA